MPSRCEYNTGQHDDRNLHLDCEPNPGFSPKNFESQILQGMKATILIDREDGRLAHIDGTLYKDVSFGMGILDASARDTLRSCRPAWWASTGASSTWP